MSMFLVGLAPGAMFHYNAAVIWVEMFSLNKQLSRQGVCSVLLEMSMEKQNKAHACFF